MNNLVDTLFAHYAEAEGPALLWYAIRIQQLPLALFGIAIAGAILPPLSRALKAQKWNEYLRFLQEALFQTWILMLPLTAALFLMGDMGVTLLYGRGDFHFQDVVGTTTCLWAYGIGLIPSALVLVLAPACYANHNYFLPTFSSFLAMGLNLVLNSLFIFIWGWGAVSVAIATSISVWINFGILGAKLIKPQLFFHKPLMTQAISMT
ncbi:MAG: murein biosynthesis integral membrane protein MurJ, partial [Chlamydiia bacterium]|nr:murein biosynthesis integral membrane protein MurJ [Chlamydiia bacterium]